MTNAAALDTRTPEQIHMGKAFDLVDPSVGGKVPGMSWKDAINTSATEDLWTRLCVMQGVTFDDVLKSISFFTATEAVVTKKVTPEGLLVTVKAKGYRAGPAGT